jgi:hypothetical protein
MSAYLGRDRKSATSAMTETHATVSGLTKDIIAIILLLFSACLRGYCAEI